MSGTGNVFVEAGKALVLALDQYERGNDPARLLDGPEYEVAERWTCSAVQLKAGKGWLVVPRADPVQFAESGRRIRAFSGGKYSSKLRGSGARCAAPLHAVQRCAAPLPLIYLSTADGRSTTTWPG